MMDKFSILLLTLIFTSSSYAFSYKVGITELVAPEIGESDYSVLATDGQVYTIDGNNSKLVQLAMSAVESKSEVKVKLSEHLDTEDLLQMRNEILGIKIISESKKQISAPDFFKNTKGYNPNILMSSYITNIDDEDKLNDYFASMNRKFRRRSECFNRAYVWSWEMSFNKIKGQRVHLGKAWLFFTRRYIRTYKYKWWFHIAPYINFNNEVRMLDRSFLKNPSTLQEWTDEFIYTKEECKIVNKYSDYAQHQEERDCYLLKSSVHYWQPLDIEKAETEGLAQKEWKEARLKGAYKNAIGVFAKPPERE